MEANDGDILLAVYKGTNEGLESLIMLREI